MATRCTTTQQFIETFHRFCDEQSFFVATMNMRQVGLETPFSIQLADKTPVLRGLCVVIAAWTTPTNPYKRPGIRLGIRRLTPESEAVFYQLQAMRTATPQEIVTEASEALTETPVPVSLPPVPTAPRVSPPAKKPTPTPTPRAGSVISVPPKLPPPAAVPAVVAKDITEATEAQAERTPGSDLVLPANPLQGLDDHSLGGFVDCTLYEETGNFFRAMDDGFEDESPAPPPKPAVAEPPTFKPAVSFLDEPTTEPTMEKRPATDTVQSANPFTDTPRGEPPPLPAPPEPIENDNSVKASLKRVEHSVAKLLDAVDTSRPIDVVDSRSTPLPAGEAYARQVAKSRARSRSKWFILGGGVIAAAAAAVLVFVSRSNADGQAEPVKPAEQPPVVADKTAPEAPAVDKPVADTAKEPVDGDEIAAVTDKNPNTPRVGEGPCTLEVKTTPAGTMVRLDGQTIGPSPVSIAGPCTKRRVDLAHPRYKAEQRQISLEAGAPNTLDVTLVRPTHILLVTSNPSGATVRISGRRAGTTPTKVPLMGFSGLDVKIEKTGYEPVTKRIYSKVPEDKLAVTLKRSLFFK